MSFNENFYFTQLLGAQDVMLFDKHMSLPSKTAFIGHRRYVNRTFWRNGVKSEKDSSVIEISTDVGAGSYHIPVFMPFEETSTHEVSVSNQVSQESVIDSMRRNFRQAMYRRADNSISQETLRPNVCNQWVDLLEHPVLYVEIQGSLWESIVGPMIENISDLIAKVEYMIGGNLFGELIGHQLEILLKKMNLKWTRKGNQLIIPLPFSLFWEGQCLPFRLLKYHDVRFNVKFIVPEWVKAVRLKFDQITLDDIQSFDDEFAPPDRFKQYFSDFNYHRTEMTSSNVIDLRLSHPTSDLYFYLTKPDGKLVTTETFGKVSIELDGNVYDTYESRDLVCDPMDGVYWFKFGEADSEGRNQGTLNLSRCESKIRLNFDRLQPDLRIHICTKYRNLLRTMSGMAGIVYSS